MTDAYVFEVHHESEVIQVNGRESVRAKYAFNKQSMEFSENFICIPIKKELSNTANY